MRKSDKHRASAIFMLGIHGTTLYYLEVAEGVEDTIVIDGGGNIVGLSLEVVDGEKQGVSLCHTFKESARLAMSRAGLFKVVNPLLVHPSVSREHDRAGQGKKCPWCHSGCRQVS